MKLSFVLAGGFGAVLLASVAQAQGLYTAAQAQAGEALYNQTCAMCHGDVVAGQTLLRPGMNPTIGSIFGAMTSAMPLDQPGSLSHTQYEDIMAYILQKNGHAAGGTALSYPQALTSVVPLVNNQK